MKRIVTPHRDILVIRLIFFIILIICGSSSSAQQITGTWKGKIGKHKVELRIIQKGDSLTGSSYYYESANNYRRYSITGHFDQQTNSAVWWDDQLLEERSGKLSISIPGKIPMLSRADFNCPGGDEMMLDGESNPKEDDQEPGGEVHLEKTATKIFSDVWDFVIDNYTTGANDPDIIDSIVLIAYQPVPAPSEIKEIEHKKGPIKPANDNQSIEKKEMIFIPAHPEEKKLASVPLTIQEKFTARQKVFTSEIPLQGDSIELRFYDNAEIDGDSISLFLNGNLIFQHIRLTDKAYTVKLAVNELDSNNELIMVAENLGSIPPNTSYMVAIVGDKRYEAKLASTENSSAMIRFVKKDAPPNLLPRSERL